jgi:hypothetical protein
VARPTKRERHVERATWGEEARWWDTEDDRELATKVETYAAWLEQLKVHEYKRARDAMTRYEGLALASLDPRAYASAQPDKLRFGGAKSVADTVHSEMVSRPKPRPRLVTTGADWLVQRAARRLERTTVGQLLLRQGMYVDAYGVRAEAIRLSIVLGIMWIKVYPGADRVHYELRYPWQVLIDPAEDRNVTTVCEITVRDKDELVEEYVDNVEDLTDDQRNERLVAIAGAGDARLAPDTGPGTYKTGPLMHTAKVIEVTKFARGKKNPGRRVVVCNGCVFEDEVWKRNGCRLVRYVWSPALRGMGGTGVVEEIAGLDDWTDETLRRVAGNFKTRNGRRTYVKQGSLVKKEDMEDNAEETIIEYTGDTPPQESVVPPLSPGEKEMLELFISLLYRVTGTSQMAAQSAKSPGVTSGRAMLTERDIFSRRLAVQQQLADASDLDLFGKTIWAVQDAATQNGGNLLTRWRGSDFVKEINWKNADLEDETYDVELQAENELASLVTGRQQILQQSLAGGLISPQTYSRVAEGTLDVTELTEIDRVQYEYLVDVIDDMLDATEDTVYEAPEGLLPDKAGAIAQLTVAYLRAARQAKQNTSEKHDPELNLEMLRNYIQQIDEMIQAAADAQAARKGQAGGTVLGMPGGMRAPAPGEAAA